MLDNKHKFEPNNKYFTIVVYGLMFVTGSILIYLLIGNLNKTIDIIGLILKIISPFLIGAFIAFVLFPLVHYLYHKFFMGLLKFKSAKLAKWLSIVLAYIFAIAIIAILMVFVAPQIYSSIMEISVKLPGWYDSAVNFINEFEVNHPELESVIDFEAINEHIQSALPSIIDKLTTFATSMLPKIFTTSISIVKGVFDFLIAIMVSVYMIADHKNIFYHGRRFIFAVFPSKSATVVLNVLHECNKIFSGFIYGKALDSLIIGILCFICMKIFGFPYAVLISVIVGITNMIPVFGPYIGGAIGCLFIIIVSPIKAVLFALLILAIQQFDGLFLGPRILGDKLGLKPIWVIFAITVGGSLMGVLGMFLGVPCFAVISYILNLIVSYILRKKNVVVERDESEDVM